MFHLFIVEDEKRTRDGLYHHITWADIGITAVTSLAGGLEALREADVAEPHILLSDIKMPHMNGIELATIIKKRYPKCKLIFLSGYADKENLMSAIELKAVTFIEKPIELEEIKAAVHQAVLQLEQEKEEELIHDSFQKTIPIIHEKIIGALLSPFLNWEHFARNFIPLYFSWNKIGNYSVVCIRTFKKLTSPDRIREITGDISSFFSSENYLISSISGNEFILVARDLNETAAAQELGLLSKHLLESFCLESTIGISYACHSLMDVASLCDITAFMTDYESFYLGRSCLFHFDKPLVLKECPEELFHLKDVNFSGMETLFRTLSSERFTNIALIRSELYKIYMIAIERSRTQKAMSWEEFECCSLDEYSEVIYDEINMVQHLGNGIYDIKIKNALHYILWNYSDPDLSIKNIADHVHLSPNYLSTLFKQQTGTTVNDFILEVRMEKARRLLLDTDLKLYEITERIGLSDANYLSTLFKKRFGITPSQCKKNCIT